MTLDVVQTALRAITHRTNIADDLVLGRSLLAIDEMLSVVPPNGEEITAGSHIPVLLGMVRRWLASSREAQLDAATRNAIARLVAVARDVPDAPKVDEDLLAPFRAAGAKRLPAVVEANGPTLSADEVAGRLGITRQAVNKRRQENRLLAVAVGRSLRYPAWQLNDSGGVLLGLEQVLSALSLPPLMALQWFNTPLGDAGTTPVELLRSGRIALAEQMAKQAGEQGAT